MVAPRWSELSKEPIKMQSDINHKSSHQKLKRWLFINEKLQQVKTNSHEAGNNI